MGLWLPICGQLNLQNFCREHMAVGDRVAQFCVSVRHGHSGQAAVTGGSGF